MLFKAYVQRSLTPRKHRRLATNVKFDGGDGPLNPGDGVKVGGNEVEVRVYALDAQPNARVDTSPLCRSSAQSLPSNTPLESSVKLQSRPSLRPS